jgi:hypothetical protein
MSSTINTIHSYALTFTKENPPPGMKDGEPMEMALRRLGDVMILKVPVVGIEAVRMIRNESSFPDDQIIKNTAIFVANDNIEEDTFTLYVKAGPNHPRVIKSDDIMIKDHQDPRENRRPAPIVKGVEIGILPVGKKIHIELKMGFGTGETHGSNFSVVTTYNFREEKEDTFLFRYEMVKGFPDGYYAFESAKEALETGMSFNHELYTLTSLEEALRQE